MVARVSAVVLLLLASASVNNGQVAAPSSNVISLRDRALTASKIYHQISTFFPDLSQKQFDQDYAQYLSQILGPSDDRREFDLASMALVATLHDGHTWFYDNWLEQNYGQPVGFAVYPLDGQWVVVRSGHAAIRVGDVIEAIDGTPTQQYYEKSRKYISGSSDRDAAVSFFDTPALFSAGFTLTLDGGRRVVIDRDHDKREEPPNKTEGRWLTPGSVAYIKIPVFRGIKTQAAALDYLEQFHDARAVILDVRGNPGLGDPGALQRSLMDKPYPTWSEYSSMHGGALLRHFDAAVSHVTTSEAVMRPRDPAYTGRLFLLIDRGCTCACEAFVMPFKVTRRAQLIGENTAGTFASTNFTQFENGMMLNVAAVRHLFPDGSRFEGIGIAPDIEVHETVQDLKASKDRVLERAMALANQK